MSTPERGILFTHIDEPGLQRIDVYERLGGYRGLRKALTELGHEQVLKELDASGLRGRGGAGFSMGKKASFLPHGDIEKYLCCNADESEPGAFKDRELMHKNPHQLIEGVLIGAFAADARHAFIYIRGEYQEEAAILDAAVGEAYARGYAGENILGSGISLFTAAQARISAARRPRCSTRSRASAGTRASSLRSQPTRVSTTVRR
jgi:NADH-quinone oxidoreductase subunit F